MRTNRGFSLIEILIAAALVAIGAMAGVSYVTRGAQLLMISRKSLQNKMKEFNLRSPEE